MTNTAIIPANERKLKNRVGIGFVIRNMFTFAYRALLKSFRNPETFMDITLMPIAFTLLFTYIFGGAISGDTASYLPIVIPGILMQTFIMNCATAGVQTREDIDKSTTNRFKSMPIARIAPIAGILVADLVRYVIAGSVVFTVGHFIGFRPAAGILAIIACIAFMTIFAWCLSWLFTYISLSMKTAAAASSTSILIMFPLIFLSNAFVPVETMPSGLQFFVDKINPLTKAVAAIREMLIYGTIGTDFWFAILGAMVILAIFIPLTVWKYMKRT
ncbi:ABC-2 type transporter [Alkaliphilus metalliredigens QYMF]|uniref:Transport permease protein n=1 Tax=Alkaliphilus metalliredigens (strain QYMF) TaxID=293826 RepID=A6TUY2_ALKMQ|nr:ABC transporter permease [Alkaliphilus metalliredigens]ABR50000.1 ABC-2 type transporter [Alkaliphilus metalliredigens QYMF]